MRTFDIAIQCIIDGTMLQISVALILFGVLLLLALHLFRAAQELPALRWLAAVALAAAVQALFLSLRWDYGFAAVWPVQVMLATVLPALAWFAFRSFSSSRREMSKPDLVHVIPLALFLVAIAFSPAAVDAVIIGTFVVYGFLFLRLGKAGENSFEAASLEGAFDLRRAVWLMVATLFGSAVVDIAVFFSFMFGSGTHAPLLIGMGNIAWLVMLSLSIFFGRSAVVDNDEPESIVLANSAEDHVVMDKVNALLAGGLAKEPGLTLSRLARRAGLPARSVSQAINRVHGRNVSQYVNDIRIAEACRLLRGGEASITQVIYESGFQTKSNFNREFLRVTGNTPRGWRTTSDGG